MKTTHLCQHCGDTDSQNFYPRMKSNCKKCHNAGVWNRMQDNKTKAVQLLGGKCQLCGYSRTLAALEFHHTDPAQKDPNFARSRGWKFDRLVAELEGCVLLCANCHREVHQKIVECPR